MTLRIEHAKQPVFYQIYPAPGITSAATHSHGFAGLFIVFAALCLKNGIKKPASSRFFAKQQCVLATVFVGVTHMREQNDITDTWCVGQ